MKKRIFVITALAAVLACNAPSVLAGTGRGPGSGPGCDKPAAGEWMADILGLSAEQSEQVRSIRESEREAAAPLRQQLAENRERLRVAAGAQPFDEAAVRALASEQAATRTELIVARARMQSRINAVLTPEQRQLAEKLRPLLRERRGDHRHLRGTESPPLDADGGGDESSL